MITSQNTVTSLSDFIQYLIKSCQDSEDSLPSLAEISQNLGIGLSVLREQLEVAKSLGFVEVKPRTGIRRLPYSFLPAVQTSLLYSIAVDYENFKLYSDLRTHIEKAYWFQAVSLLNSEDHHYLQDLIRRANNKMDGNPIQIPHLEHRELHLSIYRRLDNPFVLGLLEAYWNAYESSGLSLYTDINYLRQVWEYHGRMVDAICSGNYEYGYKVLSEHVDLLFQRSKEETSHAFE